MTIPRGWEYCWICWRRQLSQVTTSHNTLTVHEQFDSYSNFQFQNFSNSLKRTYVAENNTLELESMTFSAASLWGICADIFSSILSFPNCHTTCKHKKSNLYVQLHSTSKLSNQISNNIGLKTQSQIYKNCYNQQILHFLKTKYELNLKQLLQHVL